MGGSQIFESHIWPTVLVRTEWKPRNFEATLCGSLYSTFKTSFQPYALYKKRLQTHFIEQLVRSEATCSFNSNIRYGSMTQALGGKSVIEWAWDCEAFTAWGKFALWGNLGLILNHPILVIVFEPTICASTRFHGMAWVREIYVVCALRC